MKKKVIIVLSSILVLGLVGVCVYFSPLIPGTKRTDTEITARAQGSKASTKTKSKSSESSLKINGEKIKAAVDMMLKTSSKYKADAEKAAKEAEAKEKAKQAQKAAKEKKAAEKVWTIVLDPGHGGFGGTHPGCQYNGLTEKNLTLQVALAIKANLEQYDNIRVILTRDSDYDISLADRAKLAKKNKADFLFSIHFNASGSHMPFGSEQWIPMGATQKESYAMASNVREAWSGLGLFQKGIKTRQTASGDNYYGILRHSASYGIPSMIAEHCYLDNTADSFIWGRGDYAALLGNADANAITKYFGLKSSKTGADFSGCGRNYPSGVIYPDTTAPSVSGSVTGYDEATSTATIHVTGSDNESRILFATYSLDGVNYQPYVIYNDGADFTVQAAHGAHVYVVVANAHDMTEVAEVVIP